MPVPPCRPVNCDFDRVIWNHCLWLVITVNQVISSEICARDTLSVTQFQERRLVVVCFVAIVMIWSEIINDEMWQYAHMVLIELIM